MPPPGAPIRNRCRRLLAAAAAAPPGAPLPLPGVSWGLAYPDLPAGPPVDHLDGIVVLAGGQTEGAGVPPWVARRLDAALDLFALQRSPARCRVLLLGGWDAGGGEGGEWKGAGGKGEGGSPCLQGKVVGGRGPWPCPSTHWYGCGAQ